MRFFIMKQDIQLLYGIQFRDFDITNNTYFFTKADSEKLNDTTILYLKGEGEIAPDFIEHPVQMIAKKWKDIFDAYEDNLIFKDVIFLHKEKKKEYQYHQILMDELPVVSEETEYYPNGMEKKLILDQKKIAYHHIFMVQGSMMKHPVISLAVAESLLRRQATGIMLEEVEVR